MHAEAWDWITDTVGTWDIPAGARVLDVGGRHVNGTPRELFEDCEYIVTDVIDAPDVDVVWDARTPPPFPPSFDFVISTETLEHVEGWEAVVRNMTQSVISGGRVLITAAAPPRAPHSGVDGWDLREGEWYGNVNPTELCLLMEDLLVDVEVVHDDRHGDVYATGVRR